VLAHFLTEVRDENPKVTLLYRLLLTTIVVNLFAIGIDTFSQRYFNAAIELFVVVALGFNFWWLYRHHSRVKEGAYLFLTVISIALFTLIYINHFATMSVVFILLLPLTTLLFIRLKYSVIITLVLFIVMAILLYIESVYNPINPLVQNPQALFNLAYTAVIIYVFGLLYHFSIVKTFDELDASNRQKELLLKEVHHRVKNNLNIIASIIGLQANRAEGKSKEQLQLSKTRIESIAMVHEMLYKCDDFEKIDFDAYMRQLCNLLLGMFATHEKIDVIISSQQQSVPLEMMLQLGIIANELLTNSIKYAFNGGEGVITMELEHHEGVYKFRYSDNGVGVASPQELLKSPTLGVKLIHLCTRQLNGEVTLSSPKGLTYEIEFKNE
jgi:two-component sensor histidine kinase